MIGFGKRISYAFRAFFKILSSGEIPGDIAEELARSPAQIGAPEAREPQAAAKPESADRAVQMLAILQRDGRLIDFLTENISPYSDAQIGAAVRDLHESCKQALERYVALEPIIASEEGQAVTIDAPVDPAAIKLIGNVTGKPPLRGLLRHRGWRVSAVNLPALPDGEGRSVI
ncbi:MAG TPA: DUF2760 domain-containing protein, partial [Blastocatellia bacterium]|nr:DUF2760 domain-containing protein [Blastocatellia bacterium]